MSFNNIKYIVIICVFIMIFSACQRAPSQAPPPSQDRLSSNDIDLDDVEHDPPSEGAPPRGPMEGGPPEGMEGAHLDDFSRPPIDVKALLEPKDPIDPIKGKAKVGLIVRERQDGGVYEALKKLEDQGKIELLFEETGADGRVQIREALKLLGGELDALVLSPRDALTAEKITVMANQRDIPIFVIQVAVSGVDIVSQVGFDIREAGSKGAEAIAEQIGKSGKVLVLGHMGINERNTIIDGFMEGIKPFSKIDVVEATVPEDQRVAARNDIPQLLKTHSDVKGIFAIDDSISVAAAAVLYSKGAKDIVLMGYGGYPEAQSAIMEYDFYKGDIIFKADQIGERVKDILNDYLFEGKPVPRNVYVDIGFMDREYVVENLPVGGAVDGGLPPQHSEVQPSRN